MAQAWADSNVVVVLSEDEAYLVRAVLEDAAPFLNATYQDVANGIVSEFEALAASPVLASASASDGDTVIWGS